MAPCSSADFLPPPRSVARASHPLRLALALALIACSAEHPSPAGRSQGESPRDLVVADSGVEAARIVPNAGTASASESGAEDSSTTGTWGAVAVIRAYYAAISAHRLHDAYHLWADDGAASKQTLEEFARGFDDTRSVSVVPGTPGRIEGAAGSRFIEIPVTIDALATDGEHRHFTGSYVLRRAVVPGATAEERSWRIYSARIRPEK